MPGTRYSGIGTSSAKQDARRAWPIQPAATASYPGRSHEARRVNAALALVVACAHAWSGAGARRGVGDAGRVQSAGISAAGGARSGCPDDRSGWPDDRFGCRRDGAAHPGGNGSGAIGQQRHGSGDDRDKRNCRKQCELDVWDDGNGQCLRCGRRNFSNNWNDQQWRGSRRNSSHCDE